MLRRTPEGAGRGRWAAAGRVPGRATRRRRRRPRRGRVCRGQGRGVRARAGRDRAGDRPGRRARASRPRRRDPLGGAALRRRRRVRPERRRARRPRPPWTARAAPCTGAGGDDHRRAAPVSVRDRRSRRRDFVTGFQEAPRLPHWVSCGVYVLGEEALARFPERGDHETSTFPELAAEHRLGAFRHEGAWITVNTPKDLRRAQEYSPSIPAGWPADRHLYAQAPTNRRA